MNTMNYREEMEINLLDLLHVVLRKWRVIIAFMLLGAVALGTLSYLMPATLDKSAEPEVNIVTRKELDEMREALKEKEAEQVQLAVDSFLISKEKYEEVLEHQKDSIWYKTDAENAPTMISTYMISDYIEDTHAYMSEVTSADNIISLYDSALTGASVIQQIRDATGYDVNEVYIKELYSIYKSGLSMMNLRVNAPTRQECETIMKVLEDNLKTYVSSISSVNQHKIKKVSEDYYEQLNSSLRDAQKAEEQTIIDYQKSFLTTPDKFTADQKTYYETLVDLSLGRLTLGSEKAKEAAVKKAREEMELAAAKKAEAAGDGDVEFNDILIDQKNAQKIYERHVSKKYVALGGIAGAFLVILWYCCMYILSGVLRTEADLTDIFRLSVYGSINSANGNGKKKLFGGIDNFIEKLFNKNKPVFSEDEAIDIVCSGIGASVRQKDAKRLFITGVGNDADSENYRNKIVESLKSSKYITEGCSVDSGKNVVYDPRALEKMVQSDGVVLVEKIGSSRYANIAGELDAITKYGVDVLGAVVVE